MFKIQYNRQVDSVEYAHSRLAESVVVHKNRLVYVNRVRRTNDRNNTEVVDLESGNGEIVPLEELDCSPIRNLGYTIINGQAVFVVRKFIRRYKQGITWRACYKRPELRELDFGGGWRTQQAFILPYKGKYPKVTSALAMVEDVYYNSVPVSRSFAIDARGDLTYKGQPEVVGSVNLDNGDLHLRPDFQYLREVLDNQVINSQ